MKKKRGNPAKIPAAPTQTVQPTTDDSLPSPDTEHVGLDGGPAGGNSFPIVGIGASAGGLEAFTHLLKNLAVDTGMGFVLVQHLDPDHESALVQILARSTSMPVREITEGQRVEPNNVHVIPRDASLAIEGGVFKLQPRKAGRTPHRSIDSFFESLANDRRERAIGVVLSGTASDGTLGLEAIKAEGGITFAQDDSAKYDSMPRSAVAAGVVDFVLSPSDIAMELARIGTHPFIKGQPFLLAPTRGEEDRAEATAHEDDQSPLPSGGPSSAAQEPAPLRDAGADQAADGNGRAGRAGEEAAPTTRDESFKKILSFLYKHSGVDFSLYRSTTIRRRVARRVILTKQNSLEDYVKLLRNNAEEIDALYSDVLISVTSFFRNPEMFDCLQREVLPKLLRQRTDEPVRCWVLGCSTGQEAYSITMAFVEAAEAEPRMRRLQVFATDLNDKLLEKARQGLYAKTLAEDISPQRLGRFFVEEEGGYRVSKMLREMVVFARQNLISDPPFSRMDIVSCRNLLIYLEPTLQRKALPTFHYALRPGGYLLLGASESISGFSNLFEPVDKKHKIFAKKPVPTPPFHLPRWAERFERTAAGLPVIRVQKSGIKNEEFRGEFNAQQEADRIIVNQFSPPGVLINEELEVLQFRGPTGAYLEPPAGKASFNLLKMARDGLMLPLRTAIHTARKENKTARADNIRLNRDGQTRTISVEVVPIRNLKERCFLVLFIESDANERMAARAQTAAPSRNKDQNAPGVAELEADLAETRAYLQSTQEQHETANEELQAANEEVQSANEELQSINEEMETSKEELESANEELTTVNEEMGHRNTELNRLYNDLVNLQTSTKLAILLVGRDLAIRRFSPQAEKMFDLLVGDLGRPIAHLRHDLIRRYEDGREDRVDLEEMVACVITNVREQECEVHHKSGQGGHWFSLRIRPYMTLDNKVDGAVLVLVDIDAIKRGEQALADEAAALTRLYDASSRLWRVKGLHEGLEELLVVTIALLGADMGNVQLLDAERGVLEIVVQSGFKQDFLDHFREVSTEDDSACGRSLRSGERNVIEDVEADAAYAPLRPIARAAGYRSVQSTPLISRNGEPLGMISTHWRSVHRPDEQDLRRLDLLARQKADFIERCRSEKALRESEEARRLAQQAAGAGTWTWDRDTSRVSWSAECYELYGIDPNTELLYDSWRNALHPDDRELADAAARQAMERGENLHLEYRILHPQRGERWLNSIGRIIDPVNRPGYMTGLTQDITERKRLEQELRQSEMRFRRVFEAAKDGVLILDADGRITDANSFMVELTGTSRDDLVGRTPHQAGIFTDAEASDQAFRELQQTGYVRYDQLPLRRNNGSEILVELIGNFYREDGRLVAQCNIRDVTQRVVMENRIKEQSEVLASESRRKDEFLAMLSHELRNPLAPIRSALHLLRLQELPGSENAIQQEAREVIERQVGNLTKLVSDLLEVARVASGRIRLDSQTVDLNQVIQHAVETVAPMIEQRKHVLAVNHCSEPIWCDADPTRMEEVFINLLTNAAKYTADGGRIEVWCEQPQDLSFAQVRVRDYGVGIDPDLLPCIFDLFTQADRSLARSEGGLGIGLSLAHRLVHLHGGTIEAFSPPEAGGAGSEFIVRLARTPAPRRPQAPPALVEKSVKPEGLRVLVVDDNIDSTTMLATLLRHSGYSVQSAYTGPDALTIALQWRPDIVLLDIGLPGLDGYEVARRLRSDPSSAGETMRLIALTGYGRDTDIARARAAGFDAHMVKPIDPDELEKVMVASEQSSAI